MNNLKVIIDALVNKDYDRINLPTVFPGDIEKGLKAIGVKDHSFESNGWQYDWWLSFEFEGTLFQAHGSGYYGGAYIAIKQE